MIIETITAFVAVKITWETLEILHLLHVGHLASDAGYRGANYLLQGIQKRCQEIQDDKNPAQRLELDAKTLYNYDTPDTNTLKQLHEKAQAYLVILKSRIKNLKNLQIYFEEISKLLENLVTSLLSTDKEQHFLFNLIKLESKLLHFKMELTQFLYWFPPPPRQILY
ncbi:MAG: hypothetical protein REH83_00765, partial [Rickettsiella sp.]|nr:hypothetical protein [Rickettsiella sp.]